MRRPRRRARSVHGGDCARPRHQRRGGDVRELGSTGPDLRPDRLRAGVALGGPRCSASPRRARCCSRGDTSACSGIVAGPRKTLSTFSRTCTRGLPPRSPRPTSRSIRGTSRWTVSMSSEGGGVFTDVEARAFPWDAVYDRAGWIDLIATHSDHVRLPDARATCAPRRRRRRRRRARWHHDLPLLDAAGARHTRDMTAAVPSAAWPRQ